MLINKPTPCPLSSASCFGWPCSLREAARRLASFVDRILKGAKAGELPFEQVAKFELVIDTRVAREQKIEVPRALLLLADEVVR